MQWIRVLLCAVLLSGAAVAASAQTTSRIEGTVRSIDPVNKTITFTDGRVVQFDPSSRIFVNGREVTVRDVSPGVVIAMTPATSTPSGTVERITGTVASIDPVAKTITFTDGRVVHFDPNARIFVNGREVAVNDVSPGAVIVMTPATSTTPQTSERITGTVASIDPVTKTITFTDGRVVQFDPRSRIFVNGREVTVSEVSPGTVIVMSPVVTPVVTPVVSPVTPPGEPYRSKERLTGTIAAIDAAAKTITFTDGRMVQLDPSSRLYIDGRDVTASLLGAGDAMVTTSPPRHSTEVVQEPTVVTPAPVAVVPGPPQLAVAPVDRAALADETTAQVIRVDYSGTQVVLDDGSVATVTPSTQVVKSNGDTVVVRDLRPGDRVVLRTAEAPDATLQVSAPVVPRPIEDAYISWPGYRGAVVEADNVLVIRHLQAP